MKLPPNDSMIWPVLMLLIVNAAFVVAMFTNYDNDPDFAKDGLTLLELNTALLVGLGLWKKAGSNGS